MTESIGTRLVALIDPIIHLHLSEAEVEDYPYAVYEQTVTEHRTKDGVYKITANTLIHIYSKSFSEADSASLQIQSKLETQMRDETYIATLRTVNKYCVEGVWDIQLNYLVTQLN